MKNILHIIKSLRLKHWVKNGFVFIALIFAAEFMNIRALGLTISTFFLFCFAASSVYLLNDVIDYKADKKHPIKKNRPIASGKVSRGTAIFISILFSLGVLITSLVISPWLTLVLLAYFVNNLLYTFYFKHIVIIDVLMVSFGFILRAVGGAVAINVDISLWFIVILFLLTLFLAIMKRRQEFVVIGKNGGKSRKVLACYSVEMLDQMGNIIVPAVLVSYIFFVLQEIHTPYFIFTIPLVVYGMFRYLFLIHKRDMGENPTETLLKDLPLFMVVGLWGVVSVLLIYFFEIR